MKEVIQRQQTDTYLWVWGRRAGTAKQGGRTRASNYNLANSSYCPRGTLPGTGARTWKAGATTAFKLQRAQLEVQLYPLPAFNFLHPFPSPGSRGLVRPGFGSMCVYAAVCDAPANCTAGQPWDRNSHQKSNDAQSIPQRRSQRGCQEVRQKGPSPAAPSSRVTLPLR